MKRRDVHRAARRRGGVAARGARAGARAAHRRAHPTSPPTIRKARPASPLSLQGLQQLGWTDGGNVRIEYRWGEGDAERTRKDAVELVALTPDVILTPAAAERGAGAAGDRTVPIVFVNRPRSGRRRLRREPGAARRQRHRLYRCSNSTSPENGWSCSSRSRRSVTRAAVLRDPAITAGIGQFGVIQSVAPSLGVEVSPINVRDDAGDDRARDHGLCAARRTAA